MFGWKHLIGFFCYTSLSNYKNVIFGKLGKLRPLTLAFVWEGFFRHYKSAPPTHVIGGASAGLCGRRIIHELIVCNSTSGGGSRDNAESSRANPPLTEENRVHVCVQRLISGAPPRTQEIETKQMTNPLGSSGRLHGGSSVSQHGDALAFPQGAHHVTENCRLIARYL